MRKHITNASTSEIVTMSEVLGSFARGFHPIGSVSSKSSSIAGIAVEVDVAMLVAEAEVVVKVEDSAGSSSQCCARGQLGDRSDVVGQAYITHRRSI